jgi:hypothetical protein
MRAMNGLLAAATFTLLATGVAAQQGGGAAPARPRAAPRVQTRPPAPAAIKAVGTVRDVMIGIIEPSSGFVFEAASNTPQKPEQWTAIENGALMLAESANLLMIGGRARNEAAWARWATALRETSETAMKAARAKDAAAIETASDEVYQTCEGCHKIYLPGAAVN